MTAIVTRLLPHDLRGSRWFPLSEQRQADLKREYHDLIQSFASSRVEPDDYIVGEMLLCNNDTDYYYSFFKDEALPEMAELAPGAPVMEAHNYDVPARGLHFRADVVERPVHGVKGKSRLWVRTNYILPNDVSGQADALRVRLGIKREVSVGWRCMDAECTECGQHISRCEHAPGEIYEKGFARFGFSNITNMLEGSFVFRGGQKDTITFIPDGGAATDQAASIAGAASRFVDALSGDVDWRGLADVKRNLAAARVALNHRRDLSALGRRYLRAAGFGLMCAKPGDRQNVQSLRLSADRFDPQAAKRWVRDHDFRAAQMSEKGRDTVFTQFPVGKRKEARTVELDQGVVARIVEPEEATKERKRTAAPEVDESLEDLLEAV